MCDFDDNYFIEITKKVGINFEKSSTGLQAYFDKDSTILQNEFNQLINSSADCVFNSHNFLEDFQDLFSNNDQFAKCVLISSLLKENEDDDLFESLDVNQISVVRFLLFFKEFQPKLIDFILDYVNLLLLEYTDQEAIEWWSLISQNLSCLPFVEEPITLTQKLLDILSSMPLLVRVEILSSIRLIVPVNSYSKVVKYLKEFFSNDCRLNMAIIDCLNSLYLNDNEKIDLANKIDSIIDLDNFRKFFEFRLYLMDDQPSKNDLKRILIKYRNLLNNLISTKRDQNEHFLSALIALVNDFRVLETWPSTIDTEFGSKHEPIDLMILVVAYQYSNNQTRKSILKIVRSKIQRKRFTFGHLNDIFEHYLICEEIVKELSDTIMNLAMTVLTISKNDQPYLIQFSMEIMWKYFQSQFTTTETKNDAVRYLIQCFSLIDRESMICVLEMIQKIVDINLDLLIPQVAIFTPLLNKQNFMEVRELRITFQILGALIFGPNHNENDPLRTDISISVRKYLSCCNQNLKNRGIVAATTIAKFMAKNPDAINQTFDFTSTEELTTTNLNSKYAKEAVAMLEVINYHTESNNEAKSLFYDELAEIIHYEFYQKENRSNSTILLDKEFLKWLLDFIEVIFQAEFIKNDHLNETNGLILSDQFRVHMPDQTVDEIVINISKILFGQKDRNINSDSIVYLASIFRLYRLLRMVTSDGKLTEMDALLGCAVSLPELIENSSTLENEWPRLSTTRDLQSDILNCIFFAINWFREVISAFIEEKGASFSTIILKRIEHVIYLEGIFFKQIQDVENYKLPYSYFPIYQELKTINSLTRKSVGAKKRKLDKSAVITTQKTLLTQTQIQVGGGPPNKKPLTVISKSFDKSHVEFRQIALPIVNYLQLPLVEQNRTLTLKLKVFNFILNDTISKLKMILNNHKNYNYSMNITVKEFFRQCLEFVPNLMEDFQTVIFRMKSILEHCSYKYDSNELFTIKVNESKEAVQLILQFFYLIFSWDGFCDSKHFSFLKEWLKMMCLATQLTQQPLSQIVSSKILLIHISKHFCQYSKEMCTLSSAVYLIKLVSTFNEIQNDGELKSIVSNCAREFLERKWYTEDSSIDQNTATVTNLLQYYLDGVQLDKLIVIIKTSKSSSDGYLIAFPCIEAKNYTIVYSELFHSLCKNIVASFPETSIRKKLNFWNDVVDVWNELMNIVIEKNIRRNLLVFMKKSEVILKYFLKDAIPVFKEMLKAKNSTVFEIFNKYRLIMAYLHKICCHSMKKKDLGLYSKIPQIRLSLETVVYKIQAMLTANKQKYVFHLAKLRNRDIYNNDLSEPNSTCDSIDEDSPDYIDNQPNDNDSDHMTDILSDAESEVYG